MHLLEKEPDSRYQTADGLVYDLGRLRNADRRAPALRVGEHDFPLRLPPPSRLVGRHVEVTALQVAFEQAVVWSGPFPRCSLEMADPLWTQK